MWKKTKEGLLLFALLTVTSFALSNISTDRILAAPGPLVVNSVNDGSDVTPGDDTCETSTPGECTLRAAIQEANANPDVDTINFNITGTADYTLVDRNGVTKNGYTITITSGLPSILEQTTINGYSQPGALENTAIAPAPLNGTLLVEIDGNNIGGGPEVYSDNSALRGLVINNNDGAGILLGADNVSVLGNYIGTTPSGLVARPNQLNGINGGSGGGFTDPDGAIIGGTDPASRNIISGNRGAGITPNTGHDNWIVQGNYVGLGADGVTLVGNSAPINGPGGLSIDNCDGTIVGGTQQGATNVISGNLNFGIFPDNINDTVIQGNIIGPDWMGREIPGSPQAGGIGIPPINGSMNAILIGGTEATAKNHIAYNNGPGITVASTSSGGSVVNNSTNISILGNSIHDNTEDSGYILSTSGLGIDIHDINLDNFSLVNFGVTPNDPGDSDSGANGYINFPVINQATQNGNTLNVAFDLDATDSTNGIYRVEFFANDPEEATGHGEGETYLGSVAVGNGSAQNGVVSLPQGTNLTGKVLTATTTAVNSGTFYGFGSTSEFSAVRAINVQETGDLAETGATLTQKAVVSGAIIVITSLALAKATARTRLIYGVKN